MSLGPTTLYASKENRRERSVERSTLAAETRAGIHAQHFRSQSLEEGAKALVLDQIADDGHSAGLGLEVLVLDAGLRARGEEQADKISRSSSRRRKMTGREECSP
jgi:hypothetical protein